MAGKNQIWLCKNCQLIYWKETLRCEDCGRPTNTADRQLQDVFLSAGYVGKHVDIAAMDEFLDDLIALQEKEEAREAGRKKVLEDARAAREKLLHRQTEKPELPGEKEPVREAEESNRKTEEPVREAEESNRKTEEPVREAEEERIKREELLRERQEQQKRLEALRQERLRQRQQAQEERQRSAREQRNRILGIDPQKEGDRQKPGTELPERYAASRAASEWDEPVKDMKEVRRILGGLNLREKRGAAHGEG